MINEKKDMSRKKDLKILIEDYLERDILQMETLFDRRRHDATALFSRIFQLLGAPEIDADDLTPYELKGIVLEWHGLLSPIWGKIKNAFLDYRNHVLPEKRTHQRMIASAQDPSSPLSKYRDLVEHTPAFPEEKTYAIKVRRMPVTVNLSFSSEKFHISMEGLRILDKFLLHLKDVPIESLYPCDHCGKIIVATRKGKRYHAGCAAKAKQKERWEKDPEGCREKERKRYRERKRRQYC